MIPCLNCGEKIDLDNDIHLCNYAELEWLNSQEEAIVLLSTGDYWDLKNKKIISKEEFDKKNLKALW